MRVIGWGQTEDCHQTGGELIFVTGLFGFLKEKKNSTGHFLCMRLFQQNVWISAQAVISPSPPT